MAKISELPEWKALEANAATLGGVSMCALFDRDKERFAKFSLSAAGLFLDYSKNKITGEVIQNLFALAEARGLMARRDAMFAGERINETEDRSVLHVALRGGPGADYRADGETVSGAVADELARIKTFSSNIHRGEATGYTGKRLTNVVNIGIGGSDLGPLMAVEALRPFWIEGRRSHFVSNVDGRHLGDALAQLDPETTLFVVASKSFTTQETLANADSAKAWFLQSGAKESDIARHFVALSTNEPAVTAFGIDPQNMFRFWDWVGGRYSLWSVIGLSIALQVGFENFEKLLAGARAMDAHFRDAPMGENMPAILALVGVWNRNFLNIGAHAVLPYDQHLHRLPAYLQQADMESNGKRVGLDGAPVRHATGPIIFGEPGTNGQHAFYQLIHQGTDKISADFIAPANVEELGRHHQMLLANFLAQPRALMAGKTAAQVRTELAGDGMAPKDIERLAPHKVFPGDRPSNAILMDWLTPETLGALIALYEHKIFCQGVIWGVNSFDQWGVELGKALAHKILPDIAAKGEKRPAATAHDSSTNGLIDWINKARR